MANLKLHVLKIKNLTADVSIFTGGSEVEVTECGANSIRFSLGARVPAEVLVAMDIRLTVNDCSRDFAVTGKVTQVVEVGEGLREVSVQLRQYDKEFWQTLLRTMFVDQQRVDRLFAAIKGET